MDELGNTKSYIKELRNFHTHTLRANAETPQRASKPPISDQFILTLFSNIQSPLETIEKRKNCTKTRFLKQKDLERQ